ncbi:GvpL/GvpF family gas vesicle protein [Actinopolymorpha singaporensis]|uniref:Gas vesicle synthesis protein GvpL/GvpF n=1 Tax=Actinopolymorpha singaporensis TaxID=117157 RepID=A0A1H1V6L5_9ACTN|nr:GvpL/GvpF family gas vesicle protein [Actinopolymorpha singaporensis]SDS80016.1 Gas vesicle synthesis protein GvpL/GvpF [Actinopolymorpha singaporensis]
MTAGSARGLYLFAIVGSTAVDLSGLPGIVGGSSPRLVAHGDLAAVVADVLLSALDVREEEVTEDGPLARMAMDHDTVIRAVFDQTPALPLRLATVVGDEDAVRRLLEERSAEIRDLLARLADHQEWGVRLRREAGKSDPNAERERDRAGRPSGRAYLQARREALRASQEQRHAVRQAGDEVYRALAEHASDATRLSSGGGAVLLLNATYLVPTSATDTFRGVVEKYATELQAGGVQVELTGPWPPYSFAQVTIGSQAAADG